MQFHMPSEWIVVLSAGMSDEPTATLCVLAA